MDNNQRRLHPLIATTVGAVLVASLVGVAAVTGVLPMASGNSQPSGNALEQAAQVPTPAQQQAAQQRAQEQAQLQANQQAQRQESMARASQPPQGDEGYPAAPHQVANTCTHCGTVESITPIRIQGQATGVGAVGGAVAGGLLGNMFGRGTGRAAMTVVGAVGGGLAGNAVEKNVRSVTEYRVLVRTDSGLTRSFTYRNPPGWQPGSRVRIDRGRLVSLS